LSIKYALSQTNIDYRPYQHATWLIIRETNTHIHSGFQDTGGYNCGL